MTTQPPWEAVTPQKKDLPGIFANAGLLECVASAGTTTVLSVYFIPHIFLQRKLLFDFTVSKKIENTSKPCTVLKSFYLRMDGFRLGFTHEILRHTFRSNTCIQELLVIQMDIFLLIEIQLLLPTAHPANKTMAWSKQAPKENNPQFILFLSFTFSWANSYGYRGGWMFISHLSYIQTVSVCPLLLFNFLLLYYI